LTEGYTVESSQARHMPDGHLYSTPHKKMCIDKHKDFFSCVLVTQVLFTDSDNCRAQHFCCFCSVSLPSNFPCTLVTNYGWLSSTVMFGWSDVCSTSNRISQRTHSVSTASYRSSNDLSVLAHTLHITKTNHVHVRIYSSEVPRIFVPF